MSEGGANARLRIAHLTATFPPYPGGAGNTCFHFARVQAGRGHHVEVFTATAEGPAPDPGRAVVHRIEPIVRIGNAPLIPRIARLRGFDVLHLHYPFIFGAELTLAGRLAGGARESALLVHYKNRIVGRGGRRALFGAYEHTVAPLLIRRADRICVLSRDHAESVPYLRAALHRTPDRVREMPNGVDTEVFSPGPDLGTRVQLGIPADRICVLSRDHAESVPYLRAALHRTPDRVREMPNGVDTEVFSPGPGLGTRVRLGIPADAVVAAFVATLDRAHHFKRLDVAIEALARARNGDADGRPDLHMVVAGDGELLDGYRRQASAAGVGDRVHFLGQLQQGALPEVLRASDLVLLTTEPPESFGIVLIEAMSCGLPAVATEYPGVRAVVEPGRNGLLAPRGDVEAVAEAIASMIEMGSEGRRAMGAAGREKCERSWSWSSLADRMDEVYAEAIAARRAAQR